MAQICDKYSKTSLMGNWYEERLAPNQPFRQNLENKNLREEETDIAIAAETGKMIPLPRVKRNQPWVTKDVQPDDGFKEYRSINATTFDIQNLNNFYKLSDKRSLIKTYGQNIVYPESNQHHIQTSGSTNYKIVNQQTMNDIKEQRIVKKNVSDFGSTFKQHDEAHNRFYGMTTNQYYMSKPIDQTTEEAIKEYEKSKKVYAGYNERPLDQQSLKAISMLTGEKYKNEKDPKDNTAVQRSWLPCQDKSLYNAEKNMQKNVEINKQTGFEPKDPMQTYKTNNIQKKQFDIATSIPIADGEWALHRKYNNPGEYRHVRTEITRVMNKPLTKR